MSPSGDQQCHWLNVSIIIRWPTDVAEVSVIQTTLDQLTKFKMIFSFFAIPLILSRL